MISGQRTDFKRSDIIGIWPNLAGSMYTKQMNKPRWEFKVGCYLQHILCQLQHNCALARPYKKLEKLIILIKCSIYTANY